MKRIVLLFLLFEVSSLTFAQSTFEVISGYPLNNDCKVPASSEFQINFNSPVNISTVSSNTIKLIGHQSGFHDFSTSVDNNGQKLTIKNNEQFFAGESVTLIITSSLTNILGQKLSKSFTFNYTVRTLSSKGSFIKVKEFSVGSRPETITGADINNDGRIDLIVLNIYSYDVSILTNMGNLDFIETQRIPVGYLPESVQMGVIDIGQDNDLDIIISNRMENSISILTNNGNGMFSSSKINDVGNQPIAISSSDLDGDGFEDFVIANNGNGNANSIVIYLNTGTGSFDRFIELITDAGPHFTLINDIDNDYDNDLVVINYHGNSINVFKNDGYGQFSRFSSVGTGANPRTASLVDVNNDGFIDIALPCSAGDNLQVLQNDGTGNFLLSQNLIVGPLPQSLTSGDIDGDKDIDLATPILNQNKVIVVKNNGGTFDISEAQNTNEYPVGVNLLDIDNDGNLELIVSNLLSNNISIYDNEKILNRSPIADAGNDQTIDCAEKNGAMVPLNGSKSYDPDNDPLTYIWKENGNTIATSISPTVNLLGGVHLITLTVDDGKGGTATDEVIIKVNVDVIAPVPDVANLPTVKGECSAKVEKIPTATDACSGLVTGTTSDPLAYFSQGTFTITWTYTDDIGNSIQQIQKVVVKDETAPVPDVANLPTLTGECSVTVATFPTATDACTGPITGSTSDPLTYTSQGTFTITWTYSDGHENSVQQIQTVVVQDKTVPTIESTKQVISLWQPDHKYETIKLSDFGVSVSDNCTNVISSSLIITKVTSDEPEDTIGGGDGNTLNDIVITNDFKSVNLRKEREGTGNGRVYTIYISVSDGNGNVATSSFQVQVPHDKKDVAVNDGPVYEVLGGTVVPISTSRNNELANVQSPSLLNNSENQIIPEGFELKQNYPNPFNPMTTIQIALPEAGYYSLKVYNTLGQEVTTLLSQEKPAGIYTVKFDGSNFPSGIYFYKLQVGHFVSVMKMILAK